jgi:hypothetical protein
MGACGKRGGVRAGPGGGNGTGGVGGASDAGGSVDAGAGGRDGGSGVLDGGNDGADGGNDAMPCVKAGTVNVPNAVTVTFDDATIGATAVQVGKALSDGAVGFFPMMIAHPPGQRTMVVDSYDGTLTVSDRLAVQALNGNLPIGTGFSPPITPITCNQFAVTVTPQVTTDFATTINRQLDVVFVIQNSAFMAGLIDKAIAGFAGFVDALRQQPGGMPSLHVAVVSADAGVGRFDLDLYGCPFEGDGGQFKSLPQAPCAIAPLPPDQHFLSVAKNETTKNFTGSIEDAFACIARLPATGCAFTSPLKALRWALDPLQSVNDVTFSRFEAPLLAIIVGNQDDCSVPDDSDLMDPNQTHLTDPLGPKTTFRCNEFGHLCLVDGSMQAPPRAAATNLMGCVSNETPSGRLTHISDEVAFLKALRVDPNLVWVASIAGPPTPYTITTQVSVNPVGENQPVMAPSCTQSSTEQARPAVRLQQWARAFGDHGVAQGICADSLVPEFRRLGTTMESIFHDCLRNVLRDANPATSTLDPSCTAIDLFANPGGGLAIVKPLPPCTSAASDTACWQITPNALCGNNALFVIQRPLGGEAPYDTTVTCDVCPPGATLPGCP